jgi:anti-sigma B factor antagonist
MEILNKKVDNVYVIELSGKIMGGAESEDFRELLYHAINEDIVNVVVDLTGADWMNSSGLGMLISGLTTMRSGGGDLYLVGLSDSIRRPLEVTRLDGVFRMFDTLDDAINSFK